LAFVCKGTLEVSRCCNCLGNYSEAGSILSSFRRKHPGYAAVELRLIGMMRRRADAERNPDYSGVISKFERLIHSPDTPRHLSSYYSVKLARFHLKTRNDRRLAEKIIRRALERDRVSKKFPDLV
ncbi:hypothetical protein ANCCAN_26592, partial [Ancylostoma caninum]